MILLSLDFIKPRSRRHRFKIRTGPDHRRSRFIVLVDSGQGGGAPSATQDAVHQSQLQNAMNTYKAKCFSVSVILLSTMKTAAQDLIIEIRCPRDTWDKLRSALSHSNSANRKFSKLLDLIYHTQATLASISTSSHSRQR